MKKSELQKLIKEEVHNVILEQNYVDWFDYEWGEGFHMGGMNKIKMKNLLKEVKNSPEEQGLKKLSDKTWKYVWDTGADHGYIDNGNEVNIFPPYDAVKDFEGFMKNPKDKKGNWMVQVGSADGRINKFFWYETLSVALRAIKNELMPKYAKQRSKRYPST